MKLQLVRDSIRPAATSRNARFWTVLVATLPFLLPAHAANLIVFDFARDLTTTQTAAHICYVAPFNSVQSSTTHDTINQAARADTWKVDNPTNFFRCAFAIEQGYKLDLERIEFDYLSENNLSIAFGPTQYDVRVSVTGGLFQSVSGGWKAMTADGLWHRGVSATNGGVVVSNLSGYVTIAFAGADATDKNLDWALDNIKVCGQIRADTNLPAPPSIATLEPRSHVLLQGTATQQFYSLQSSSTMENNWQYERNRANLVPAGQSMSVDLSGLGGQDRSFFRILSSRTRMPAVDLAGYWQVSSSNMYFRKGVMRLEQMDNLIRFETAMLGKISDWSFLMAEGGMSLMTGVHTNSHLRGQYSIPMSGIMITGVYDAVSFTGSMYDVWQGTNALTATGYYDPGANGYTKVGQGDTTATFAVSAPYLVVAANKLTPIDAIRGSDGNYLSVPPFLSMATANTTQSSNLTGAADGIPALVGNAFSEKTYRGYVVFAPSAWTSMTVHVLSVPSPWIR